jgi:sensor c-di-GMP phosphodiesterase-like protein
MKTTIAQRVLLARAATIVLALGGMIAGYQLGRVLALETAENWLEQYSRLLAVQQDASSVEAHDLLTKLNHSTFPACSDGEIGLFRELVFKSEFIKDAGRIHGGKIDCSATEGRSAKPLGQFAANTAQPDGTISYRNLVPLHDTQLERPGLQMGSAYVVIGSHVPPSLGPIPISLNVTTQNAEAQQAGAPATTGADQTTGQTMRDGDTLYTTRCSAVNFNCVTASTRVPDVIRSEIGHIAESALMGTLAGILAGLILSMFARRRRNLEQQLRRAIAQDKLEVMYQPIVRVPTGRIVGAEALVRWVDEEGNAISPEVFVKLAEEHGFVGGITKLVVRRVLSAFGETLRKRPSFRVSINASATDLADPSFLPMLDEQLKWAKVDSKSLVIEITESSTANREVAMETIRDLRRRGHSIHIDDFGTGYSSLSYLLYLSVDTIKIDKAFTRVIGTEAVTVAILPQILAMAKSLNMEVIVEGVETAGQEDYFSETERPVYGQGWLYGRPLPAEQFLDLLAENWDRVPAPKEKEKAPEPELPALTGTGTIQLVRR